jgi:hypothetical protein
VASTANWHPRQNLSTHTRGLTAEMASPPKMDITVQHEIHPRTMLKQVDQAYVKNTSHEDTFALTARTYVASSERPQRRQNCWGNDQWVSPPAGITARTKSITARGITAKEKKKKIEHHRSWHHRQGDMTICLLKKLIGIYRERGRKVATIKRIVR